MDELLDAFKGSPRFQKKILRVTLQGYDRAVNRVQPKVTTQDALEGDDSTWDSVMGELWDVLG